MKQKLIICSLELGPKSIMLPIHLKTMDTMEESSTHQEKAFGSRAPIVNPHTT